MSSERVRDIVELLYHRDASLAEKVAWRLRKGNQPYPAEFPIIQGARWSGQVMCGANPWLLARRVDGLIIDVDTEGKQTAKWIDRYPVREVREKVRRWQGERSS